MVTAFSVVSVELLRVVVEKLSTENQYKSCITNQTAETLWKPQ